MRQILKFFSLQSITSLFNLFIPIILVRIISPSEVGEYRIFFFYLQSLPFLSLSSGVISSLLTWGHKKDQAKIFMEQSVSLIFIQIILIFILGSLFYAPLGLFGFHYPYYFYLLGSGCLFILSLFFDEFFIAIHESTYAMSSIFITEVTKALAIIYFAYKTQNLEYIFLSFLLIYLIKILFNLIKLKKLGYLKFIWIESIKSEIVKYSLPLGLSFFIGFFADKGDQFIVSLFSSKADFAFYGLGCLLIPPLFILEQSATRLSLTKFSLLLSENKIQETTYIYREISTLLAFFLVPSAIGLIYYSEPLIQILFGASYLKASLYLKIFGIFYLTLILPQDLYFRATNQGKVILKFQIISVIATFILMSLFGYFYSTFGILIGFITAKFLTRFFYIYQTSINFKFDYLDLFPIKKCLSFTATSFIILVPISFINFTFDSILIKLLVEISAFTFAYFTIHYKYITKTIKNDHLF